jgi:hypothetical protein
MPAPNFDPIFAAAGQQYNVDPNMLKAIALQESSLDPSAQNGSHVGLMQFDPGTATRYGVQNRADPVQSIFGAAHMFANNLNKFGGDVETAVAAHQHGDGINPNRAQWGNSDWNYVNDVGHRYQSVMQNPIQLTQNAPQPQTGGQPPPGQPQPPPQQSAPQADPNDPINSALMGGKVPPTQAPQSSQGQAPTVGADPIHDALMGQAPPKPPVQNPAPPPPQQQPAAGSMLSQIGKSATQAASNLLHPLGMAQAAIAQLRGQPAQTPTQNITNAIAGGGQGAPTGAIQASTGGAQGIMDLGHNLINLGEKGVAGLTNLVGLGNTGVGKAINQTANQDVAAQQQARQRFSQSASPLANLSSYVSPMLAPIGPLIKGAQAVGDVASAVPLVGGALKAAANYMGPGAAIGAASDVNGSPQDYWGNVAKNIGLGAGVGAAASGIGAGAGAIGRGAQELWNYAKNPEMVAAQHLISGIGSDLPNVTENLQNAQQFVPGSAPTTAQAANNPFLVQQEKALGNTDSFKNSLMQRQGQNNQAQWNAINNVAQTPQILEQATNARNATTSALRNAAFANGGMANPASVDQSLQAILDSPAGKRPAVVSALNDVRQNLYIPATDEARINSSAWPLKQLMDNPGNLGQANLDILNQATAHITDAHMGKVSVQDTINNLSGLTSTSSKITNAIQNSIQSLGRQSMYETDPAQLYGARQSITDALSGRGLQANPQNDLARSQLMQIKGQLDNTIEQAAPGYLNYLDTHHQMSVPLNTMKAGQAIAGRFENSPLGPGGQPLLNLGQYNTALNSQIKANTFGSQVGLDPNGLSSLEGVRSDLQRATLSNSVRFPGSDTAYNLSPQTALGKGLMGKNLQGGKMVGVLGALGTGVGASIPGLHVPGAILGGTAGAAIGKMLSGGGAKAQSALQDFMLNPNNLLPYLQKASSIPINNVSGLASNKAALLAAKLAFPAMKAMNKPN